MPSSARELAALYQSINAEFFENALPPCEIRWSRRLTRAAGNIRVEKRLITLSIPLLCDAFAGDVAYVVCGVECRDRDHALQEILKHEMIHLWLFERGLPCGHTATFRVKARAIGQPKTRHGIALPLPKRGWIYSCRNCGAQVARQRRVSRAVACAKCCKDWGDGKFDARFVLVGRRARNSLITA